ncbi:MAG: cation-transporting P-type ATPase [Clostridia bacterium]|nr:cation-transporting P-type ATPase [Clostridia bacterium]
MIDNWYQMTGDAVAEKLKTSKKEGLTRKAARSVMRKHGKNEIYPVSKITFYNCLKSITFDYTSYLLIATALIAAIFEESKSAWVLVTLVAINLLVTLLIYAKSQRILEGMDRYTLPVVRVIRDGRLFMIDQKMLVPGDLICLSRGDIVPADVRLISAEDFCVDEERLFGRGHLKYKVADIEMHETVQPQNQRNMAFAGTLVTSGTAMALVCATGDATVIVAKDKNRPIISHESMPLLGHLQRISRIWSLVVIAAVFVMTFVDFLMPGMNNSLFSSFIGSLSFAVSTMSEMYVAFGYVILACTVQQTVQLFRDENQAGAILKNPLCMESLRNISCLIVPKEGIFSTRNTVADRIFVEDKLYDISDRRGRRAMERPILFSILSTGMYGEAYLNQLGSMNGNRMRQTEEETAILNLARRMDIYNIRLDRAYPLFDHRSSIGDSDFETSLVSHKNQMIAISRGETEKIIEHCSYYYKDGRMMLLTKELKNNIMIAYRKLIRQTYAVVAVASKSYPYKTLKYIGAAQREMVFEGFVAFRIPYLRGIGQFIQDAKEAGIKVIMTSDRPVSAEIHFAKQVGIIDKNDQCTDSLSLRQMKESIRRTNASYYRLYCGLNTKQKMELIEYLHGEGEVVGVVGKQLEDLCLLRAADVSFAQNISVKSDVSVAGHHDTVVSKVSESTAEDGCEALKFESDIIVSDAEERGIGGFRAMLDTIGVAKNTEMNIVRIMKFLITSQTARFILVFYNILFSKEGMSAVQTLFLGLFADFMVVLILALQKPSNDILRSGYEAKPWLEHPIKRNISSVLTGICWAASAILASFFASFSGFAETGLQQGTVLFLTSCLIGVITLFSVQTEEYIWRPGIRMNTLQTLYLLGLFELILLFFLFPKFGMLFGIEAFKLPAILIILVWALIQTVLTECIKMLVRMKENPATGGFDEETEERHMQITALFHMFRNQKEQEESAYPPNETVKKKKKKLSLFARSSETHDEEQAADAKAKQNDLLSEMEAYVNQKRAETKRRRKNRQKAKKPKKFTIRARNLFREDDGDFYDVLPHMYGDHYLLPSENMDTDEKEGSDEDRGLVDPEALPDVSIFEEAMAIPTVDPGTERDITIGGADVQVRSFLRSEENAQTAEQTAVAADREFMGIGYLFSEEEYEAIMAEYNSDGTTVSVYNTETRSFDTVLSGDSDVDAEDTVTDADDEDV